MSTRTYITTMGVDVSATALANADTRVKASSVALHFIEGTTLSFTINDRHLRKIVDGLDAYLKSKGE